MLQISAAAVNPTTATAAAAYTRTALMLQISAAAVAATTATAVTVQALVAAAIDASSSCCHDPEKQLL